MSRGFEAQSLGLVKMAETNTDPRFTAVEFNGNTIWALHPKYFNDEDVVHLEKKWGKNVSINTSVYVGTVQARGQLTHNDYETIETRKVPIHLGPNPFTGKSPIEYANSLTNGTGIGDAEEYAPFYLNYGVTANSTSIDISTLKDIDMYADSSITVSHPDGSITVPLSSINAGVVGKTLTVNIIENTSDGFLYEGSLGGVEFSGTYSKEYRHFKIISNYQSHMLQNRRREAAFEKSASYNAIMGVIGSVTSGFDLLGGVGSIMDTLFAYGLREHQFNDMKGQMTDLGGNLLNDLIGFHADDLITIQYPIPKYIAVTQESNDPTRIRLGQYAENRSHSYDINGLYPDMKTAISAVKSIVGGEIIGGDFKPVVDYGSYSKYFQQVINRGGLL